jgi:hypothetical protein
MIGTEGIYSMTKHRQRGNVLVYVLIAIFLTGLLIAAMSQGAKKSASSEQLSEMLQYLQLDIKTIQTAIDECVQSYPGATAGVTNPNTPFPLYNNLGNGGTGDAVAAIKCPGAPSSQQIIFNANMGNNFKALADTTTYTTQYFNDGTEGVYIRITRATPEILWTEAISRLNTKYSKCAAAAVTAAGTCVNGCLYYWILRLPTSVLGPEAGCPS